ncbi:polysaccharide pyruvyl transferase family protein [Pseudonocardia bannensis]|uniref:Polysaccharide pyruvyl transferase family protein n=1 Tax=Pseudonocardia bannensis TaxID=630973 RepID=A0A848DH92_9PSEU|nr:polysaccharide pyruvyl transferase family protein [Pseudonocardia bannensis]NMH91919.1 polysaccharide pyruvyl transferase family protein [Pseudonocardia bannensis]
MRKVVLLNAYSAENRGDGLLVELAVDLVQEAVGSNVDISVIAADPDSFSGLDVVSPLPGRGRATRGAAGAVLVASGGRVGLARGFATRIQQADLIVSVGGGYLRGGHAAELLKSTLVHGAQIMVASRAGVPWIMLPQSIGPYPNGYRQLLAGYLKRAQRIFLRDDVSTTELRRLPNVARVADTAILEMGKTHPTSQDSAAHHIGLVIRNLRAPGGYHTQVRELFGRSDSWMPVVQSTYSGNDDTNFYLELLGVHARCSLEEALQGNALKAVVSVRLHGALRSIMLGVPAIHLSYERKGRAAFEDLGLGDYVFDARTFRAQQVSGAIESILQDPGGYWGTIHAALHRVRQQRTQVIDEIRAAVCSTA